jgi:hypothetical protein
MIKLLIAISTCEAFEVNGTNQAVRDTWLQDMKNHLEVDYKFFVGHGPNGHNMQGGYPEKYSALPPDVVQVNCLDDYGHLTYKTQESLKWAFENNYDFVFRAFPDTFVRLDRLMESGFKGHDYHGDFRGEVTEAYALNYASGGAGYWLSRGAYRHLLNAPILGVWRDELMVYVEDMWVGNILGRARQAGNNIVYFDDNRFINHGQDNWPTMRNKVVTSHLSPGPVKDIPMLLRAARKTWGLSR